jgi:hypothetical protein
MDAAPAEMEEICLPAPGGTDAGFSVEELNDSMHVSLLEEQEVARFHMKRHKLLGNELHPLNQYIFDVPGDGSCQFAGIRLGLEELMENPPADDQEVRNVIVDYLLENRESLEDGQQISFLHGDSDFREAVFSAYDGIYTFDMYCAGLRNPVGVKANCEWGDGLTLGVAKDIWSVNILVHSISP